MGGVRPNARKNGQISPFDHHLRCPRGWQSSTPHVSLAGRPEKLEYSRQFGSHPGNPSLYAADCVYTLIFVVAAVLAALQSRRDLQVAWSLVVAGAIIVAVRWTVWATPCSTKPSKFFYLESRRVF
jgi:hypothetical protein